MTLTETLFKKMNAHPLASEFKFPPDCYHEIGSEFLEYREKEFCKVAVPIKPEYNNPAGLTLGGYYGVFFDITFGPFSFLVLEKYATTLDLNITYLRPLQPKNEHVIVEATVANISRNFLNLDGKAFTKEGKLVATATSRMMVVAS